jgi:hypothetical protein
VADDDNVAARQIGQHRGGQMLLKHAGRRRAGYRVVEIRDRNLAGQVRADLREHLWAQRNTVQ